MAANARRGVGQRIANGVERDARRPSRRAREPVRRTRRAALSRGRWVRAGAAAADVVGLAVGLAAASAGTVTRRSVSGTRFRRDLESVQRFGRDLWTRNGYGTAAAT